MCRVLNKRKTGVPAGAVYIGRHIRTNRARGNR